MRSARIRATGGRRILPTVAGAVAVLVLAPSALAETDSVRFEFGENGTWTVPDRVTEIEVEVAGAGGGGGGAPGGNGALVRAVIDVAAGTTFDVGVGGGGEATLAQQSGGGGASIVESGDILLIAGGGGGATTWVDSTGGNAGHDANTGAGQNGGFTTKRSGGTGGSSGTGGVGAVAPGSGADYNPSSGAYGTGGQRGRGAAVGGAGGEDRDERYGTYGDQASPPLGRGGGAGYGGGSSGFDAFSTSVTNTRGGGGAGGSIAQGTGVSMVEGASSYYSSIGGSGGSGREIAGTNGWVVFTWVIPAPLPTDAGSEDGAAEPIEITLAMPEGLTCDAPQTNGSGGWVRLPVGNDCIAETSSRTMDSGSQAGLLGWATTPDFPVDLAQRQVDNGWGAYELMDSSDELSAVFIPAGGWTKISGDTNLFPIWAG